MTTDFVLKVVQTINSISVSFFLHYVESTFFLSLTSNFSICKLTDVELVEGKRLRAEPHFSRDLLRLMVPQAKATILPSVACAEDFDSVYYCLAA